MTCISLVLHFHVPQSNTLQCHWNIDHFQLNPTNHLQILHSSLTRAALPVAGIDSASLKKEQASFALNGNSFLKFVLMHMLQPRGASVYKVV